MSLVSNNTSSMRIFTNDLVMAFPRIMARAGSFAFVTVPERLDSMIGLRSGGSMIAEATGNGSMKIIPTAFPSNSSPGAALRSAPGAATTEATPQGLGSFSFHQVRNFGGIFAYMTSKWALACFTLVSLYHVGATAPVWEIILKSHRPLSLIVHRSTPQHAVTSICHGQYDLLYVSCLLPCSSPIPSALYKRCAVRHPRNIPL